MPKIVTETVEVETGYATGLSVQWADGQFVVIVSDNGVLACGAIDVEVMEEFDNVIAVAEGTPEKPLVMPEDLLNAKISRTTGKAEAMGIKPGMSGKEALEKMLKND
ncbi:hypothetical protein AKJ40_04045 [candidate division MSBL1 archaeon SCGC-AAA259M10]|uniref:DUF1805 domain-containing protein n=1 Tax=candidate division MSBL1 archaeon SCGC-AAA259M10 TaxID=1698270 RepID=A0A133UY18_9EURY|nr:hypothetical protein AKJ40_04045 [candidate division MSBL1 archaeon SCGC-AAA259M10]